MSEIYSTTIGFACAHACACICVPEELFWMGSRLGPGKCSFWERRYLHTFVKSYNTLLMHLGDKGPIGAHSIWESTGILKIECWMSLKGYSKIYQFEMFSPSIFFSRANTILFPQISIQIRFPFSGSAFRPKLWTTSLLLPCFHFCSRRFLKKVNFLAFGKCRNRYIVAFSSIWELYGRATHPHPLTMQPISY